MLTLAGQSGDLVTAFQDLGPGVEAIQFFTQPLFVDTTGFVTLGSPFTAVVLDSAF